jgi:hypothetical protein
VKVGDLVKFKNNGMLGLVVKLAMVHLGDEMYTITWTDGHTGPRWADELEVVSESR